MMIGAQDCVGWMGQMGREDRLSCLVSPVQPDFISRFLLFSCSSHPHTPFILLWVETFLRLHRGLTSSLFSIVNVELT